MDGTHATRKRRADCGRLRRDAEAADTRVLPSFFSLKVKKKKEKDTPTVVHAGCQAM